MATSFGEDPTDYNALPDADEQERIRRRAVEQAARTVPTAPTATAPAPVATTAAPVPRGNVVAPVRPPAAFGESIDSARSQALMEPSTWSQQREKDAIAGRERLASSRYPAPIVTPARPPSAVVLTPEERARGASVSTPTGPAGTIGAQRSDGTYSQTVVGRGGQPDTTQRFANEASAVASLPRMAARPVAKSAAEAFLASRGGQAGQPVATNSIVPPVPPQISGARASAPVSPVGQPAAPSFAQMQREAVPVSPVARPADTKKPLLSRLGIVDQKSLNQAAELPGKIYQGSAPDVISRGAEGSTARSPEAQLATLRAQLKRTPEGPARQAIQRQIDQLSGINIPANIVPPARPVARGPAV